VNNNSEFTFIEHLAELRDRLIHSAYGLLVTTVICYNYSFEIFNFIRKPIAKFLPMGGLIFTGPFDKFIAHLKLSFIAGVILASPFWLYQVWKFIAPGLYAKEKKYTAGFIIAGTVLFLTGCAFSYYLAMPMALEYLMTFGGDIDKPMISIDQYLGFFAQMCLMFGAVFELPLILIVLGMMGIVSHEFLKTNRRYAIMILAIAAAIITPPDLLSMVMALVPMILFYEVAVLVVGLMQKSKPT
jgi:sec-independent protein translocase protein TatC